MSIKLVVAVTDRDWFGHLRWRPDLTEVNFWAPSGRTFRALKTGELFLFKLHAPMNFIVGGGVFAYATTLPCSLAWDAFGPSNGAATLTEMRQRIAHYRRAASDDRSDFAIGCRILTQPFFLPENKWIPVPASWSPNIVTLKTYTTDEADGRLLWDAVRDSLAEPATTTATGPAPPRYGVPTLVKPRLGQGGFRVLVTDIYGRQCAVTGERTLPALDAAHIRPYECGGEHTASNGLLLRRDVHSLFDAGYVTVTPDLKFEVSHRIREEFDNGKHYYALHGTAVGRPTRLDQQPAGDALRWHNEHQFKG